VRLFRSDDLTYASSMAYYALVSLFPLLIFTVSVLGRVTDSAAERAAVTDLVLQFFPEQVDLVANQLDAMSGVGVGFGLVGMAVIAWVSLGVFRVTSMAVNHAWDLDEPPGMLRHQAVAFMMLLASGALLLVALAWISIVELMRASWFAGILEAAPALDVTSLFSTRYPATIALIVVVALVHHFVPAAKVRFRDVWLGAVLTGVLWHMALAGFSWYLAEWADVSVHGSIATVVTFLFWVYISAVIFLYGVEFSAAWARLRPFRDAT
jgi:membrane protein